MPDTPASKSQATDDADLGVEGHAKRWRLVGRLLSLVAMAFLILGFVYRPIPEPALDDGGRVVRMSDGQTLMVIPADSNRTQKNSWFLAGISFMAAWWCSSHAVELRERQRERKWKDLRRRIQHGD